MLSSGLTRKAVAVRRANSSRSARVGAVRNGSRVCMMQTLKPQRRYENLSYLPQLTPEQTAAQVQYLLNNGWSPCIEFAVGEDQTLVQQSLQYLLNNGWSPCIEFAV